MELKEKKFTDVIMGAEKEMAFTIDTDSSVIFEILRNKMYKDKIGSICREVMSNSRDANREAGSTENISVGIIEPDDIYMVSHQCVSFEDKGIGITPDRMSDIFLKYGASTKRGGNEQTGGFGLGAKTPFAYNDTFTIITTCEVDGKRIMYWYTALIDSTRRGKMALFHQEETTEPTGTKVLVPIKTPDDRREFEQKAYNSTKYWGCVDYNNFVNINTNDPPESVYEGDGFFIARGSATTMLIDGIPYPLDNHEKFRKLSFSRNYGVVLRFNTGDLTISANREAVQYDEDTVDLIAAKLEEVYEHLKQMLVDYLNSFNTYIEACIFKARFAENMFPDFEDDSMAHMLCSAIGIDRNYNPKVLSDFYYNDFEFLWNGKEVKTSLPTNHHNIVMVRDKETFYSNRERVYKDYKSFPLLKAKDMRVYLMGEGVGKSSRRNETIFDESSSSFLMLTPLRASKKKDVKKELRKLKKEYGVHYQNYGDVALAPRISPAKKKVSGSVGVRKINQYSGKDETETLYINQDKTKIYFDKELTDEVNLKKSLFHPVDRITTRTYQFTHSTILELGKNFEGYKVNVNNFKKLEKVKGVKTFEQQREAFRKKNEKRWKKEAIIYMASEAARRVVYGIEEHKEVILPFAPTIVIRSLEAIEKNEFKDKSKRADYKSSYERVRGQVKFNKQGVVDKFKGNLSRYPMIIPYLNSVGSKPEVKETIETYIKQVDCYEQQS